MALYENGILISGANTLPQMTLAEYQALPVSDRPTYWERTDGSYSPLPASQVSYKNGSVEDALDELNTLGSNLLTQNLTVNHQTDAVLPIAEPLELNRLYVMSYNGTQEYNDSVLFMFTGNNVSISCMASIYSNSPMRFLLTRSSKYIYWSLLSGTTTATITITSIRMVK